MIQQLQDADRASSCRYRPFISAEVSLKELIDSKEAVGSGSGLQSHVQRAQRDKAEALIERYLALGNDRQEFFELPTPLFRTSDNVFRYMVPGYTVCIIHSASSCCFVCLFLGIPLPASIMHMLRFKLACCPQARPVPFFQQAAGHNQVIVLLTLRHVILPFSAGRNFIFTMLLYVYYDAVSIGSSLQKSCACALIILVADLT